MPTGDAERIISGTSIGHRRIEAGELGDDQERGGESEAGEGRHSTLGEGDEGVGPISQIGKDRMKANCMINLGDDGRRANGCEYHVRADPKVE